MDLKPCPFCGSTQAKVIKFDETVWGGWCPDCQMTGPVGDTVQDAADLWNRRPITEPEGKSDD